MDVNGKQPFILLYFLWIFLCKVYNKRQFQILIYFFIIYNLKWRCMYNKKIKWYDMQNILNITNSFFQPQDAFLSIF